MQLQSLYKQESKMKKIGILVLAGFLGLGASVSFAAPEVIAIKDRQKSAKEKTARARLKNISISEIEDPAARRAIQQIVNYLGLETQK